jgi:hypothetical protein
VSVHWEPDEEPTTKAWIELQQTLAEHSATIMIWEDQPLDATKARLANVNIAVVPFQTAANRPVAGDYLSVMEDNANRLALLP